MSLTLKTIEPTQAVFELSDFTFTVGIQQIDGRVYFNPEIGWNELSLKTGRHIEWLSDEIDEAVYNAIPDLWSIEQV